MSRRIKLLAILFFILLTACPASRTDSTQPAQSSPSPSPAAKVPPSPSPEPAPSPTDIAVDSTTPVTAPGVLRVMPDGTQLASAPSGSPAGRLRGGVLVPFTEVRDGWARITTPCELNKWMPLDAGERLAKPAVVLDPGHGGGETGAVGPTGLQEKEVNLDVSHRTSALLNGRGIPAILTRSSDYRATLAFRVALADAAGADLLISVHHNADPDGPLDRPGAETYYQYRSPSSKRLAGLVYEEIVREFSNEEVAWVGDTDAGAKWRLNSRGEDYYGILRRAGDVGVAAVLAELAFVSNPAEEVVLRRDDFRQASAGALVRAVERYLGTSEPGSGFTTPYPRTQPAGPGGGGQGCVDPV